MSRPTGVPKDVAFGERRAIGGDVRCTRCSRSIARDAWSRLPLHRTLSRAELGAYVNVWPADVVVEVRSCSGCGTEIARRARAGELCSE